MMNPTPLQRLLALLQDPDPSATITLLPPKQLEDLSTAARQILASLHSADLSLEQIAKLSGLSVSDAMALLSDLAEALPVCLKVAQPLDLTPAGVSKVSGLLLQLSALARSFAAVYEGADAAMLETLSQGDHAVAQTLTIARAKIQDPGAQALVRQHLIANSSELAQQREAALAAEGRGAPAPAPPEQEVLADKANLQAFLDAVRAGHFSAPRAPSAPVAAAPSAPAGAGALPAAAVKGAKGTTAGRPAKAKSSTRKIIH